MPKSQINTSIHIDIKPFLDALKKVKKATKDVRTAISKLLGDIDIGLPHNSDTKLIEDLKKDLKKAIKKANKAAKKAAKKAGKKAGESYSSGFNDVMKTALGVGIGALLTKGLASATALIGQATKEFIDLDAAVNNIGTLGVGSYRDFVDISIDLSKDLLDTSATVANGIYQAYSAGMQGSKEEVAEFVSIASKAAVAGLTDTESAVNGMTSVINAYGKTSKDAQEVSDTFFGTIKLGKTTFEEMNASLANFVPSAAAMGVGFDQAGAAIANLTAMGTPTSQAGTQMNAVFTLLAKGTKPLNKALEKSGTDLDTLRNKLALPVSAGGGLVNVLREIKVAADNSGVQIEALTGRVEAAKIIRSLAGDVDKYTKSLKTYSNIQSEIQGGASTKAFEVASKSIAVQFAGFKNTIIGVFQKMFAALLPFISNLTKSLTGIFDSPAMKTAISGFTKLMVFLADNAEKVGIALGIIGTAFAAMGAKTLFANGALKKFALSLATNPILMWGAAIAAVTVGLMALIDALTDTTEEQIAANNAAIEGNKEAIKTTQNELELAKSKAKLIAKTNDLHKAQDSSHASHQKYFNSLVELKAAYPELIDLSKSYDENIASLNTELANSGESVGDLTNENQKLIKRYGELSSFTKLTKEQQTELKGVTTELNKIYPGVISKTGSLADNMSNLNDAATLTTKGIAGLNKELAQLNKDKIEFEQINLELNVDKALDGIAEVDYQLKLMLKPNDYGNKGVEIFNYFTTNSIKAAKSIKELDAMQVSFSQGFVKLNKLVKKGMASGYDSVDISEAGAAIDKLVKAQRALILSNNDLSVVDGETYYESVLKGAKSVKEEVDGVVITASFDNIKAMKSIEEQDKALNQMILNFGALEKATKITKSAADEYRDRIQKLRKEIQTVTIETDKSITSNKKLVKSTEEKTESIFKEYDANVKKIKQETTIKNINAELLVLEQGRKKTKQDDLIIEKNKSTAIQAQLTALQSLKKEYGIKLDDQNNIISSSITITEEDREKFELELSKILLNISKSKLAKLKINVAITDEEKQLDEQIKELSDKSKSFELKINLIDADIKLEKALDAKKLTESQYQAEKLKQQKAYEDRKLQIIRESNARILTENKKLQADITAAEQVGNKKLQAELERLRAENLKLLSENKKEEKDIRTDSNAKQVKETDSLFMTLGKTITGNLDNTVSAIISGQ